MCLAPELDPRELSRRHANATKDFLALDLDAQGVIAGRDVRDREVLMVDRVLVIARAVGLDERERRLLRLGLDEPVDAGLLDRLALGVPHLPRDEPSARERIDP